ncbi:Inner membrane protein yhjX [Anaerobiospirillum thomasii]|uniref:OFA family MFS transporter n=1 Tax=Anaerobiospirillum thomasii TaxID=179995 RepID=UPI000D8B93FF|nr:OFA family MFS transporter [Anaerobiospirillum thomasii]SPT67695.1 Inner membrane protein yhjX [Anaerobiospirillum thomasii]
MSQKYKTLIGSLLALLALGSVYAWSLFNRPLADKFDTDLGNVAFTFGVMSLALAIGGSISGQLKLKIGITNVVILSACLVGAGCGLAAFAPNTIILYLTAGLLLGLGDGMGYMLVLTNCVRFFPNNKGLVSALSIGAYGGGSLIFKMLDSFMMSSYGIETALLVWGIVASTVTAFGAMLIYDSIHSIKDNKKVVHLRDFDLKQSIKTKEYWILSAMFFIDCMCGLYVIGVVSDIGTNFVNLSFDDAAAAVSVVALSNILGRLIMGMLSDKLPRIRLITFDQVLSLIAMLILLLLPVDKTVFYICVALIAFSFGGTLTIYPSIVSDFFGLKNFAKNYGLLYLGFGIGSLSGSIIAIALGSFTITFVIIAVLLVIAIVLSLMVVLPADLQKGHKKLVSENKLNNASAVVKDTVIIGDDKKDDMSNDAAADTNVTDDNSSLDDKVASDNKDERSDLKESADTEDKAQELKTDAKDSTKDTDAPRSKLSDKDANEKSISDSSR